MQKSSSRALLGHAPGHVQLFHAVHCKTLLSAWTGCVGEVYWQYNGSGVSEQGKTRVLTLGCVLTWH